MIFFNFLNFYLEREKYILINEPVESSSTAGESTLSTAYVTSMMLEIDTFSCWKRQHGQSMFPA
jgi:hypothetical protein